MSWNASDASQQNNFRTKQGWLIREGVRAINFFFWCRNIKLICILTQSRHSSHLNWVGNWSNFARNWRCMCFLRKKLNLKCISWILLPKIDEVYCYTFFYRNSNAMHNISLDNLLDLVYIIYSKLDIRILSKWKKSILLSIF